MIRKICFLDWDDTLLFTSFIKYHHLDDNVLYGYLAILDDLLILLYIKLVTYYVIYVVTNADYDWVILSCKKYLPKLAEFISFNKINIISAKDADINVEYRKLNTFKDIMLDFIINWGMPTEILSVGDSDYEHNAALAMHEIYRVNTKILKMIVNPLPDELINQLRLFFSCVDKIEQDNRFKLILNIGYRPD